MNMSIMEKALYQRRLQEKDEEINKLKQLLNHKITPRQRKTRIKRFIKHAVKSKYFTKRQGLLLIALASCDPTSRVDLITATKVKEKAFINLKALVTRTNRKLNRTGILIIKPLYGYPFNGYILKIDNPLLTQS